MITGNIVRQRLNLCDSHVVADTIDYLEAKFIFKTYDWDGLEKWVHFAKDSAVYDIRLTNDCIRKEDHLNLFAGMWKVYLHGNEFRDGEVIQRITTDAVPLSVSPTGILDGEPFPTVPPSAGEQIIAAATAAESGAKSAAESAEDSADRAADSAEAVEEAAKDIESSVESAENAAQDAETARKNAAESAKSAEKSAREAKEAAETIDIPENVSAFNNDAGYLTAESDPTIPAWAKQERKPAYTAQEVGALPADTKIPAKTSDIANDSGFITKVVADLANYYTKSETYTQAEINALVSAIPKFVISVVTALPTANISETTVYLVKSGVDGDLYTEYIYVNGAWEILGSQRVDLTGYATETWVNAKLEDYLPAAQLSAAINEALAQAKESGEFDGADGIAIYAYAQNLSDYEGSIPPDGTYDAQHIVSRANRILQVGDLLLDIAGNIYRVTVFYPDVDSFDAVYVTNIHGADGEQGVSGKDGLAIYAYNGDLGVATIAGSVVGQYSVSSYSFTRRPHITSGGFAD